MRSPQFSFALETLGLDWDRMVTFYRFLASALDAPADLEPVESRISGWND